MNRVIQTISIIILAISVNAQQLNGVYILSEGGFSSGTSMLSKLSLPNGNFSQSIFSPGNIGLYSDGLVFENGNLYLVEQGSFGGPGKVYKLNTDGSLINSKEVGINPYSLAISNGKVYITNGPTSSISVVRESDLSIVKEISVGVYPQEIISLEGKVFVANNSLWGGDSDSTITVISSENDEVISTIIVKPNPSALAISNDNHLLIGCPGEGESGIIFKVELDSFMKVDSFKVNDYGFGKDISVDKYSNKIYFKSATNHIVSLDLLTGETNLELIDENVLFTYGYRYDYLTGNHYLTDAKDFVANGSLNVYSSEGTLLNTYETSTAPRRIAFDYSENTVSIEDETVATNFSLEQNYPNPFNPTTTIKYTVPSVLNENLHSIQLIIYDGLGKKIVTLVNEKKQAGVYEVIFDASQLSSGIYYYKLRVSNFIFTKKMLLVK